MDCVQIDSRHVVTRDGKGNVRWLVLLVEPDWWQGTVRLMVARTPADELEF